MEQLEFDFPKLRCPHCGQGLRAGETVIEARPGLAFKCIHMLFGDPICVACGRHLPTLDGKCYNCMDPIEDPGGF